MNKINYIFSLLIILISSLNNVNATASMRLLNVTGEPIKLELKVNQEAQLAFEYILGDIGIPDGIKDVLEVQSIDSRLWLKAKTDFKPVRFLIKDQIGNISILLLSAKQSASLVTTVQPIKYNVVTELKQKVSIAAHLNAKSKQQSLNYVDLTRFAAQTFYAPKRLVNKVNVIRKPIDTKSVSLFACSLHLSCNGNVLANPVATWHSKRYYITAVMLKNKTNRKIILDPRDLIGRWKSATFQFNSIGRAGTNTDTSMVYLVSLLPFEQSLRL